MHSSQCSHKNTREMKRKRCVSSSWNLKLSTKLLCKRTIAVVFTTPQVLLHTVEEVIVNCGYSILHRLYLCVVIIANHMYIHTCIIERWMG